MSDVHTFGSGNVREAAEDLFAQVSAKRDHLGRLDYGQTTFYCQFCDEHNCVEFAFGPRGETPIFIGQAHSVSRLEEVLQAIVTMENIAYDMRHTTHSAIQLSA